MIHLVQKKNYNQVKDLIGSISHGIFPGCVCNGDNPGWIYANDPVNPTSAFVYMKKLGGTLIGDSRNEDFNRSLKENLESVIVPKLIEGGDDFFCVTGNKPDWDKSIESILENKKINLDSVSRYKYKKIVDKQPLLEDEYIIKKITKEMLYVTENNNIDLLVGDIKTWWGSIDRFIELGFGFAAFRNEELCGWSYSVCIFDSKVEIYIETVEKYRSKGVASAIAYQFVKYCIENELHPEWEAISDNIHSLNIARKIGFEFDYKYKLFEFSFDEK